MTQRRLLSRPLPRLAAVVAAALPALPVLAAAESELGPYYVGVSQAITGDTNVYRAPKESERKDIISSTSLLAGIDQPIGRMRLAGKASVDWNHFVKNEQLRNTSHDVTASIDGSTIERLSGGITVYDRQRLNRSDLSTAEGTTTEKDQLHTTGASVRARLGLVTTWTFETGYSFEQSEHSLEAFQNRDVRQGTVNAGIRVAPSDKWSARVGVRRTDGRYPNYNASTTGAGDEFTRDDVDLSLTYVPTGNSRLDARISRTNTEHTLLGGQRDRRSVTGLLGYDWTLTGKTRMRFQYARDTGVGRADQDLALLTESSDTQTRDALMWRTTWDATSKITVNAVLNHSRRTIDNAFTQTSGGVTAGTYTTAKDRTTGVGLSVGYDATRNLRFGCNVNYDKRSVDGEDVNTTYPYDVTTAGCNVAWLLR